MDTQKKLGDVFVHQVKVTSGELTVGAAVDLAVDHARRAAIRANHSATHLLHEALRLTLGDHVAQKGSLVSPERLRFDISHPKGVSDAELDEVEAIANRLVLQNEPVVTRLMGVDEAIASGARALFGEKYGEEVRVVSMGTVREGSARREGLLGRAVRRHPCGADRRHRPHHHRRRGRGGGRRPARRGDDGRRRARASQRREPQAARARGPAQDHAGEAVDRLATVLEERRRLERELAEARKKLAMGGGAAGADPVREIAGVRFIGRAVTGVEMKDLKGLADEAKKQVGSGVVAIIGVAEDGKAGVVVGVTEDMTARFDAVALVRAASEALGGKGGGGRRDMAQAGGPDGARAKPRWRRWRQAWRLDRRPPAAAIFGPRGRSGPRGPRGAGLGQGGQRAQARLRGAGPHHARRRAGGVRSTAP